MSRREERRIEVVGAIVNRGEDIATVVRVYDVAERTLFDWLAKYRKGGWQALRDSTRSGRPRKVTGKVMSWLYNKVTQGDPRQFKLPFGLWTLEIIRSVLKKHQGIELSKSAVSRLLRHMGLSAQRPVYRSYKRNQSAIDDYLAETYPVLKRKAARKNMKIYFIDEAAVRSDSHHGTTWAPCGDTPSVEDSGDRFTLKMISAVEPRGDMRFSFITGRMNSDRFIDFLRKLRKDADCPIIAVVDNASYHKSKKTVEFGKKEGIDIALLPTYCPELNPDEQVWNHAKRRLGKLFVVTKDEMKSALMGIMRSIQGNTKLIQSFFNMKDTKYAAVSRSC